MFKFDKFLQLMMIACLIFLLFSLSSFINYGTLVIWSISLFSFFLPVLSISMLLFCLPIFGNRPGTEQSFYLLIISLSILLGLFFRILFFKNKTTIKKDNCLIFLAFAYILVSILSLIALPYKEIIFFLKNLDFLNSYKDFTFALREVFMVSETNSIYSIVSLVNTIIAATLAYFVYLFSSTKPGRVFLFSGAILGGWFFANIIGLADYFSLIDLRFFRSLDPVVNYGNTQYRLQSFFGHSGWFAEYVTLVAPFVMLFLGLKAKFVKKSVLIILSLLLGELILILCYQRGGWLAYPLTLIVVWFSVYAFSKIEKGEKDFFNAIKSSAFKVLISLPITVILSIALVGIFQKTGLIEKERFSKIDHYIGRFKDISKVSDRSEFIHAGFLLGTLHPFYGGGSEGFGHLYEKEFQERGGKFYEKYNLPLHGSAHNVYMQTFSGKGLAGIISLLLLLFYIFYFTYYEICKSTMLNKNNILFLLIGASFASAFLIYGNVQEIFYIQSLQILFFLVIALLASRLSDKRLSKNFKRSYLGLLCLLLLLHVVWEFVYPGRSFALNNKFSAYGCYYEEDGFRWCAKNSSLNVPVKRSEKTNQYNIYLKMKGSAHSNNQMPYDVEVYYQNQLLTIVRLKPGEVSQSIYQVPFEKEQDFVNLTFKSKYGFIPSKVILDSKDARPLSFKIVL